MDDWHALNTAIARAAALNKDPDFQKAINRASEILIEATIPDYSPTTLTNNRWYPKDTTDL
jgi:hypothetical protein